jgi:glycosyltransferase involved in cell wall biosynthesis
MTAASDPPAAAGPGAAGVADRPLVSFFVLAYRQEHLVRATIEAAFAQTWQPLEILLSDDCSPDGTFRVMEEMAAAYQGPHRVILNRNPRNLGIVGHVDRVMELTRGELVVQNSGDDVSLPERTERLVTAWLASGRRAHAIHSARRRMDEAGALHEVFDDARVLAHMTPLEVIRDHGTLVGATLAWSRELWRVFGPLGPIPVFDDFPTCLRAALIGEIDYVPEPLLNYRTGGTSATPQAEFGRNYLYGFRIKSLRWHRSFWQQYLVDMAKVNPPDYAACRRICEEKIREADFCIELAESSYWRLPLALPGALARSLERRDPMYLREVGRYLLGSAYMRRLDRKVDRKRRSDRVQDSA